MTRRTRANPSPGGLKSLPLDAPRKMRQPRTRKTADLAAGEEGASILTQSSAVTASAAQNTTPLQAHSPPTTTSRSQSPHPDESGSQSPQPAESRSTSPPPAQQHNTRSMTRSMSRSMSPANLMDASTPTEPKRSSLAVSKKQSPIRKTSTTLAVPEKQSPLRKSPSTSQAVGSASKSLDAGEQRSAKRTHSDATETGEQQSSKRVRTTDAANLEPKRAIKRTYSHETFGPGVESDEDVEEPPSAKRPRTGPAPVKKSPAKRHPKSKLARKQSLPLSLPSPQGDSANEGTASKSVPRYQSIEDFDRQLARILSEPGMIPPRITSRAGVETNSQSNPTESGHRVTTASEEILPVSRFVVSRTAISEEARQEIEKNIELYADPPRDPRLREEYLKKRGITLASSGPFGYSKMPRDADLGMTLYGTRQSIEGQEEDDEGNESEEFRDFQPSVLRNRSIRRDLKAFQANLKKKENVDIYRKTPSREISTVSTELHIPSTSSSSARVLTIRPELIDSLVSFYQWFENHPSAKPPTAEQLGSLLESYSQSSEAHRAIDSTGGQSPSSKAAPAAQPSTPQHPSREDGDLGLAASDAPFSLLRSFREDGDFGRAASSANTPLKHHSREDGDRGRAASDALYTHSRPSREDGDSGRAAFDDTHTSRPSRKDGDFGRAAFEDNNHDQENGSLASNDHGKVQRADAQSQTPQTVRSESRVPESRIWHGLSAVKNLVATPFRYFGGRSPQSDKKDTANGKQVPPNPFRMDLAKAGLVIPPNTPTPTSQRPRVSQSARRRNSPAKGSHGSRTGKLDRRRPLERNHIPIAARGIVSPERIAEIHAEQDRLAEERRQRREADHVLAAIEDEEEQNFSAKRTGSARAGEKRKKHPYSSGRTANGGFCVPTSPSTDSEDELESVYTPARDPHHVSGSWINSPSEEIISPSSVQKRPSIPDDKKAASATDGSFSFSYPMWIGDPLDVIWRPSHGILAKTSILCENLFACYEADGRILPESEHIQIAELPWKMPKYKALRALPTDVQDYIQTLRDGEDLRFETHEWRLRNQYYELEKKIYAGKVDLHRDELYRFLEDPKARLYGTPIRQTRPDGTIINKKPVKPRLPGVFEVPDDSDSSGTEEEEAEAQESHDEAEDEAPVLQERTWHQTPPPKPRPANAELPKPQTVSHVDKYRPKQPSGLRNVTAMSPLQEEEAAFNGRKSALKTPGGNRSLKTKNVHFTPPGASFVDVLAAVMAAPLPEDWLRVEVVAGGVWDDMCWEEEVDEPVEAAVVEEPVEGPVWEDMSWEEDGIRVDRGH